MKLFAKMLTSFKNIENIMHLLTGLRVVALKIRLPPMSAFRVGRIFDVVRY